MLVCVHRCVCVGCAHARARVYVTVDSEGLSALVSAAPLTRLAWPWGQRPRGGGGGCGPALCSQEGPIVALITLGRLYLSLSRRPHSCSGPRPPPPTGAAGRGRDSGVPRASLRGDGSHSTEVTAGPEAGLPSSGPRGLLVQQRVSLWLWV